MWEGSDDCGIAMSKSRGWQAAPCCGRLYSTEACLSRDRALRLSCRRYCSGNVHVKRRGHTVQYCTGYMDTWTCIAIRYMSIHVHVVIPTTVGRTSTVARKCGAVCVVIKSCNVTAHLSLEASRRSARAQTCAKASEGGRARACAIRSSDD